MEITAHKTHNSTRGTTGGSLYAQHPPSPVSTSRLCLNSQIYKTGAHETPTVCRSLSPGPSAGELGRRCRSTPQRGRLLPEFQCRLQLSAPPPSHLYLAGGEQGMFQGPNDPHLCEAYSSHHRSRTRRRLPLGTVSIVSIPPFPGKLRMVAQGSSGEVPVRHRGGLRGGDRRH